MNQITLRPRLEGRELVRCLDNVNFFINTHAEFKLTALSSVSLFQELGFFLHPNR